MTIYALDADIGLDANMYRPGCWCKLRCCDKARCWYTEGLDAVIDLDADIRLDDHTRPDAGIHLLYTIKNWSSVLFVYINKIPVLSILLQRYSITRFLNSDFFIKYLPPPPLAMIRILKYFRQWRWIRQNIRQSHRSKTPLSHDLEMLLTLQSQCRQRCVNFENL